MSSIGGDQALCSTSVSTTLDEPTLISMRGHLTESADEADEQSKASDQTVVTRQQQLAAAAQAPVLTSTAMQVLSDQDRQNDHPDDEDDDDDDGEHQGEQTLHRVVASASQQTCQDPLVSRMRDIIEGPGERIHNSGDTVVDPSGVCGVSNLDGASVAAAQRGIIPPQSSVNQQPRRARHSGRSHCSRHHHLHHQQGQQGAVSSPSPHSAHHHHHHHHHQHQHQHQQRPSITSQTAARQQQDFCLKPRLTSSNDQRPITGDHRVGTTAENEAVASDTSSSMRPQADDNIALNDQSKTPSSSSDSSRKVLDNELACGGESSFRTSEKQDLTPVKDVSEKENLGARAHHSHHHGRRHSHAHHHHHHHHRANHKRRFGLERAASGDATSARIDKTMIAFGGELDTVRSQDADQLKGQVHQDSSNIGHCPHHHHICAEHSGSSACKRHSHHHHHHHHSHHHHSQLGVEQESNLAKSGPEASKAHAHHGHHHHHHHHHHHNHHHHGHHARHKHRSKHKSSNDGLIEGESPKGDLKGSRVLQSSLQASEDARLDNSASGAVDRIKSAAKQGAKDEDTTSVPDADDTDIRMHLDEEEQQQEQNKTGSDQIPSSDIFEQSQNQARTTDYNNDGEVRMDMSPNGNSDSRLVARQVGSQVCEMISGEDINTSKVDFASTNYQTTSGPSLGHQGNGFSHTQPVNEPASGNHPNENHQGDKQQILRQISSSMDNSRKSSQREAASGAGRDLHEIIERSQVLPECSQDVSAICRRTSQPRQVIESYVAPNDRRCRMCWCCCCPCSG